MEYKCNKQYWLENVLKKLYKKVHSLEKPKNRRRRKHNTSTAKVNANKKQKTKKCQEKDKSIKYQVVTRSTKQKSLQNKNFEKHAKKKNSNSEEEKFWKFVDAFLQSRSFLSRSKNAFFVPVIPSTVNNTLLKSIGNTLTLRSRVISRRTSNKSAMPGDYGEEGFLRSEINSIGGKKAIAQKIFITIQKARMKKAADVIAKEVLGERKAKKS